MFNNLQLFLRAGASTLVVGQGCGYDAPLGDDFCTTLELCANRFDCILAEPLGDKYTGGETDSKKGLEHHCFIMQSHTHLLSGSWSA